MEAAAAQQCSSRRSEPLLPPGFRFHPTDEELIECYLIKKVQNNNFSVRAIGDVDLNKNEPWELPDKAKMGEKEWYFFTLRDRKYPTGMRTNRATEAGYWKATGKDRDINRSSSGNSSSTSSSSSASLVGAKKTLVFYRGRAPKGVKTNWIMHEYRLEGEAAYLHNSRISKDSEWVVCRIFQKSSGGKKSTTMCRESVKESFQDKASKLCEEAAALNHSSLPPLLESPHLESSTTTVGGGDPAESFSLLKHIPSASFIKFASSSPSYDQGFFDHQDDQDRDFNIPHGSPSAASMLCKMEPSSTSSFQQQQQRQQQQQHHLYGFNNNQTSSRIKDNNNVIHWLNQDPTYSNLSNSNDHSPPGLADIIDSSSNSINAASIAYYRAVAGLSASASTSVDLESLWNY